MNAWNIVWEHRDLLYSGLINTLKLFGLSGLLSFISGFLILIILENAPLPVQKVVRGFTDLMRMMPFLIFTYLLYYGLPEVGIRLDAWLAGLLALTIYHGAYFAEIFRGFRASISRGQSEAAKAHGYTTTKMIIRILVPQIIFISGPVMANQFIMCLKDTAFLNIITVQELTGSAVALQSTYFIPIQAFVIAVLLYWIITLIIDALFKKLTRKAVQRGLSYE